MLQPQNYPRFIGQALFLEPEPFVAIVDDDNPWIEGLFLCACISILVAVTGVAGGLLLTASLPSSDALLNVVLWLLRQSAANGETIYEIELSLRSVWPFLRISSGYDTGWFRFLTLAITPLSIVGQWLLFGLIAHLLARAFGGRGSLGQTLGAMSLSTAPRLLYLLTAVSFVSVAALLVHVWGILIAFRGMEVAHELPPGPAALVAVGSWILLFAGSIAGAAMAALVILAGGGL